MWLNENKTLLIPEVIEMTPKDKQTMCPTFQTPSSMVAPGGQRVMQIDVVMPRSVFLKSSARGIRGVDISLLPEGVGMILVSDVLAWVWEDDRLRPPPPGQELDS